MALILRKPAIAGARRVLPNSSRRLTASGIDAASVDIDAHASDATDTAALAEHEQQLAKSLREAEEAGKHAYEEGYETGLRKGEAEGRDAYISGLQQLEELAKSLNRSAERGLEESEDTMVSIVFESVCKIIGTALATREGVAAVVEEALSHIRGKSALAIRVNPLDLELIEESAAFGIVSEADWRADDSILMGGCVIESEYGTLDARIDTQINQLKRVLLAARHKSSDAGRSD